PNELLKIFFYVITFISHFHSLSGAKAMWRDPSEMKKANYIGPDKYFHARGKYEVAQKGHGSVVAAKLIRDAREASQRVTDLFWPEDSGRGEEDSRANQRAKEWGRSGKDPNHFRPAGLPDEY
uniref:Serum amyloid A protein n=1 Tax=Rhinolophus ferrumequinum TaxID=59479 RepID=A0A671G8C3_RHIFE